ncbi:hypothetical protein SUDANB145_05629 [Streptomyces sp. enrichment culture]|uniref:hypothetical protein n=1 Tax=Streptomyces sp. enrichment culture TaxID=1795815 RepID=UPI003F547099
MSRQAWSHSAQAQAVDKVVVTDEQTGETRVGTVTAEIKGELSEAVPAPAAWAEIPSAGTHVPGMTFLVAVIPDEDPDLEPTVHIHSHDEHVIP